MSYYYNYFLGYKDNNDGLFYPLGPYDMNGNLHDVFSRSRSFASDLHEMFYCIPNEKFSDALKKEYTYQGWNGELELSKVNYLPLSELPSGSYIRKGYFLIDDIVIYEKSMKEDGYCETFDIFIDFIPTEVYAQMMQNEITFGTQKQLDEYGDNMTHSCRDYAFYAYPETMSIEYEAELLRRAVDMYEYGVEELNHAQIVILETEG